MATTPADPAILPVAARRGPAMGTAELVIMVAALMALNALAIDVMLPALDDISVALGLIASTDGASDNRQQLIIYAYVAGFGAPQIVFGPVADRFGRRGVLLWSLAFYAAVGVACMFARDFTMLLISRFFQGVAASGVRVVAVSVVRDLFAGRGMARIMSLVMTIFMVVPILAPSIGQGILMMGTWPWTFGVLAAAGVVMFAWVWFRLPETLPPERRGAKGLGTALSAYAEVFRNRCARGYMLASGVIFGSLFAFIGAAEQIFTEVFRKEETFTLWFAGIALTLSVANFTNSRLVERFGMRRISHTALILFTLLALTLLGAMSIWGEQLSIFFPLFALMFACFGLIGSNFNAMAMEPLGRIAGTASAAYGFATTTISSLIGYLIGSQYDGTVSPVIIGFFVLGAVSLIVVTITEGGAIGRNAAGSGDR
ncbi:MAG: multidrug effflux MFS transporter [Pseudomonadota bacterium]